MLPLYAESRWELPASSAEADITHRESVQNSHTDEPPAAKKKKTAEHADVEKVVYFSLIYNFKLLLKSIAVSHLRVLHVHSC